MIGCWLSTLQRVHNIDSNLHNYARKSKRGFKWGLSMITAFKGTISRGRVDRWRDGASKALGYYVARSLSG